MERGSIGRWMIAIAAGLLLAATGCQSTGGSGSGTTGTGTGTEFREDPMGSQAGTGVGLSGLETIYFDFDRYDIREDQKAKLRANAQMIKDNAGWGVVTVEGHCDERGSEEYNLALGERRANGVKRYLTDLGVPSSRLGTVSFGEAKPSVMGHDESAWRYNRRSEFSSER